MMSKERLVDLITQISCISDPDSMCLTKKRDYCEKCGKVFIEHKDIVRLADYLLANGVIVPPLKIGQELWDIHYNKPRKWEVVYLGYNGKEWHINIHWWKDRHNFKTLSITYPFMGKMWYLTREESEAKLKEGAE